MTTPTDPTTLRTALEALESKAEKHRRAAEKVAASAEDWRFSNGYAAAVRDLRAAVATPAPPTPPATEPVAALGLCQWTPTTEPCLGDPDDWRHRRCLPEGDPCPDPCPAMPGCHPYTPAAARAEVDVEALVSRLAGIEWVQPMSNSRQSCPACEGYRDDEDREHGHRRGCWLNATLAIQALTRP